MGGGQEGRGEVPDDAAPWSQVIILFPVTQIILYPVLQPGLLPAGAAHVLPGRDAPVQGV